MFFPVSDAKAVQGSSSLVYTLKNVSSAFFLTLLPGMNLRTSHLLPFSTCKIYV